MRSFCHGSNGPRLTSKHFPSLPGEIRGLITMLITSLPSGRWASRCRLSGRRWPGLTPMLRQELADMPRQQSKTLDALLRLNGAAAPAEISKYSRLPLNVVTTQLGRLKAARYVVLEGGGKGKKATYRVADQMFSVWYWMRYVPVARRRIELFIDFLRAWFSAEERKRLYQERLERFHQYQSRGLIGMARNPCRMLSTTQRAWTIPRNSRWRWNGLPKRTSPTGDWPSAVGAVRRAGRYSSEVHAEVRVSGLLGSGQPARGERRRGARFEELFRGTCKRPAKCGGRRIHGHVPSPEVRNLPKQNSASTRF